MRIRRGLVVEEGGPMGSLGVQRSRDTSAHPQAATPDPRVGYLIGLGVNVALLYLVNVRPGWQAVPFLTGDMEQVIDLVNLSLAAGAVANGVYLMIHPAWLRALGGLVTTGIGLVALLRLLDVFPFDFGVSSVDWATAVRVVIVVGIVGSVIGIVVQAVTLVRHTIGHQAGGERHE
jgi:hypothetical protein